MASKQTERAEGAKKDPSLVPGYLGKKVNKRDAVAIVAPTFQAKSRSKVRLIYLIYYL